MKQKLEITEQDIFKFVFFKERLSDERLIYLEDNSYYKNQIKYYQTIKNGLDLATSDSLKMKIASKISAYKTEKIFFLYPRKYEKEKSNNEALIYAAKTADVPSKISTATFTDEDGKFLVRKVSTQSSTKLYIFSTVDELIQNFTIKILPDKEKITITNNNEPIELPGNIKIESIEIELT